jgi:hypothetical protein
MEKSSSFWHVSENLQSDLRAPSQDLAFASPFSDFLTTPSHQSSAFIYSLKVLQEKKNANAEGGEGLFSPVRNYPSSQATRTSVPYPHQYYPCRRDQKASGCLISSGGKSEGAEINERMSEATMGWVHPRKAIK